MLPAAIREKIEKTLKVHLRPSVDSDGDPVLRIWAVIDVAGPDLEADKVFTVTSVVRDALESIGDTRFPLVMFPASNEELPEAAA
jgi:hypothetical protein